MGFSPRVVNDATESMMRLYKLFIQKDATMVEINPMAESSTHEG
jgi:succinyl-CoA synthetase beta subunit